MSFKRLVLNGFIFLFILGFLLIGSISKPQNAAAHPDGEAHHNPLPTHATDVMRAFREDNHAPQALSALPATTCSNGFADVYPCSNIDLESFMPLADIGGTSSNSALNDIWGWTDSLTGKEYAIVGRVFGTSFVDISDPAHPIYLGNLPTHGAFGSDWRDIKTYNDHAFIVSEAQGHGMQVFDLTLLRNVTNPPVTFAETAFYRKVSSAHNIVINEGTGYAYIVGASGKNSCSGGLHIVNISDPLRPTFEGCFSSDGYTHDAQCVIYNGPDADHQGKEICFNSNEDTLTIVDVTNKANPIQLSRVGYTGVEYTHQGWLTEGQDYFLLDDELDELYGQGLTKTYIWDVSDLDTPALDSTFFGETPAIDHNQYIKGDYSYQANYRAGLRILDISKLGAVSEAAFFDIYPADDEPQFNAAWSNYPYFDSGIVIVSGIEQGLFVLRPNLDSNPPSDTPPSADITSPTNGTTVAGEITITASADDDNGVTQVEFFINGTFIGNGIEGLNDWSINWDTTSGGDGSYTISAIATDTNNQTGGGATSTVTVDNDPDPEIHVGDIDGSAVGGLRGGKWSATVTILVHNASDAPVNGATVSGNWNGGADGAGSCTTDGSGTCQITVSDLRRNASSVTFTVTDVSAADVVYNAADNHDPDDDSDGTFLVISKPQ